MNQLIRFDTNSLNKALVGFDRLFEDFESRFANQINQSYPPYNIIKFNDNEYEIQVAVSGFDQSEVTVEVDQNQLIIKGRHSNLEQENLQYLHRGLAARDFVRTFTLAEHMEVGEGFIKNGVLKIELKRVVPESLKPRMIKIKSE